jgi:hypothetical protein
MRVLLRLSFAGLLACGTIVAQGPSSGVKNDSAFRDAVHNARTIYVAVYHNAKPGMAGDPPGEDVTRVLDVLRMWPITSEDDRDVLMRIKDSLRSWGRFRVTRLSEADLILVVDRGVNKFVDGVCVGANQKLDCSGHVERDGSLSLYSTKSQPGLIWRRAQPSNVIDSGVRLMPELRKDVDNAESRSGPEREQ